MSKMKRFMLALIIALFSFSGIYSQGTSSVQAIHNSADPVLDTVNVFVSLLNVPLLTIDSVAFRSATPLTPDLPAGLPLDISIGLFPGDFNDVIGTFPLTLEADKNIIGLVLGVTEPGNFAANPGGRDIQLAPKLINFGQFTSNTPGKFEFSFAHGVTDAPAVDIVVRGGPTLVDDAAFGDITSYIAVDPDNYILDVTDASGTTVVASFQVDVSTLADSAAMVFASGFLDPGNNQNGASLGVFAALPSGAVIEFPAVPIVGIADEDARVVSDYRLMQNFPNPFNPSTTIAFTLPTAEQVTIKVANILGQEVATLVNERYNAGRYEITFDARDLTSGIYFYTIQAGDFRDTKKMMLMK